MHVELSEYKEWVKTLWQPEFADKLNTRDLFIMSLGLPEEAGEVAGFIKKFVRDGTFDEEKLVNELGDVFYYLMMICIYFNIDPHHVVNMNVEKLESRKKRGTLRGSGDDR